MNKSTKKKTLCVAGFIYFEVYAPSDPERPPDGAEIFISEIPVRPGGALNTAAVARALGTESLIIHPSGGGLTDIALAHYVSALGIRTLNIPASPDPAVSIVFSGVHDRSFISSADCDSLGRCPRLPECEWVHVPGIREARILSDRLKEARDRGTKISISGSWHPGELDRLCTIDDEPWDLLFLNAAEAERAAGSIDEAGHRLQGSAAGIIVTRGPSGSRGFFPGGEINVKATEVDVKDSTGAGDAFCAGFLSALMRNRGPEKAMEFASRVASRQLSLTGGVPDDASVYEDLRTELTEDQVNQ